MQKYQKMFHYNFHQIINHSKCPKFLIKLKKTIKLIIFSGFFFNIIYLILKITFKNLKFWKYKIFSYHLLNSHCLKINFHNN